MTFFEMTFLKMLFFSNDAVLFTDKVCIDLDFECPSFHSNRAVLLTQSEE